MNRRPRKLTRSAIAQRMTRDEICGHISDAFAIASLSNEQMVQRLLARVNGVGLEQLLAAALAVAREEYGQRIQELEPALAESEEQRWELESELQELRDGLKRLLAEGE